MKRLPRIENCERLFMDVETTSFDDKEKGFNPWKGHRIAGIAVCTDADAYYVPIRHQGADNYPVEEVMAWVQDLLDRCGMWINHNVKFDAHFLAADGVKIPKKMVDTVVLSKLIFSDRLNHQLKDLCREIGFPMKEELELKAWLRSAKTVDYGALPVDICGRYAKMDVLGNRALYNHLRPLVTCEELWETECALTQVLYKIEASGMNTDTQQCKREQINSLRTMIGAADVIKEETGSEFTNSSACLYDLLCVQLNLPVLAYTNEDNPNKETGGPSFDKKVLKRYLGLAEVVTNPSTKRVITAVSEYRRESQFKSLYCDSFLERGPRIHPSYNQIVRTGRMSGSDPNPMQLNKRAKRLILPDECFFSTDASQVEFRVIAHYMEDPDVIEAYRNGEDFHSWVAKMCSIPRSQAKTINFAMAFGAGKARITQELAAMMEWNGESAEEWIEKSQAQAAEVYRRYFERLPFLKPTADAARVSCRRKGFVQNLYGRRRHLTLKKAHNAFNTCVQGTAMDIIKRKMILLDAEGIDMKAIVHDEILVEGTERELRSKEWQDHVIGILESATRLSVPLLWDRGTSTESWADVA